MICLRTFFPNDSFDNFYVNSDYPTFSLILRMICQSKIISGLLFFCSVLKHETESKWLSSSSVQFRKLIYFQNINVLVAEWRPFTDSSVSTAQAPLRAWTSLANPLGVKRQPTWLQPYFQVFRLDRWLAAFIRYKRQR